MIRKYGSDEAECLAYLEECRSSLAAISDEEGTEARLVDARDALRADLAKAALALSEERARAAQSLDARMEEALSELGLAGAKFQTLITHQEDPEGFIKVQTGAQSPFAPTASTARSSISRPTPASRREV